MESKNKNSGLVRKLKAFSLATVLGFGSAELSGCGMNDNQLGGTGLRMLGGMSQDPGRGLVLGILGEGIQSAGNAQASRSQVNVYNNSNNNEVQPKQVQPSQSSEIDNIWVEHNAYKNNEEGIDIHIKFEVRGEKGYKVQAITWFFHEDKSQIKDFDGKYNSEDGYVSTYGKIVRPKWKDTTYKDYEMFIPYSQLNMSKPGLNEFLLRVGVGDMSREPIKPLTLSRWFGFHVNNIINNPQNKNVSTNTKVQLSNKN